jgi:hypothetical protein
VKCFNSITTWLVSKANPTQYVNSLIGETKCLQACIQHCNCYQSIFFRNINKCLYTLKWDKFCAYLPQWRSARSC